MFSLASIATMSACIFLFGLFFSILVNFQYIIRSAEEGVAITVFFDEEATDEQIQKIGEELKARDDVSEVKYISAEQAWEDFQKDYFGDNLELAEGFKDDNPLANQANYSVYMNDITKQSELVSYIEGLKHVRLVNQSEEAAKTLGNVNKLVSYVSIAIIALLLIISIFLISNTISVAAAFRRRENEIMRYIGATNFMIRAPFIVEGLLLGLFGAVIPLAGMTILYKRGLVYLNTNYQMITGLFELLPLKQIFPVMAGAAMALGVGIGAIVSFLTIQRHLRV